MHLVGFEPTIPIFEQAKIVHALDRAATVIRTDKALWQKQHAQLHAAGLDNYG
jgi:hypothetical protein